MSRNSKSSFLEWEGKARIRRLGDFSVPTDGKPTPVVVSTGDGPLLLIPGVTGPESLRLLL